MPEPRLFSFNAPQGACPACDGLGEKLLFDEDLVVPNHDLSIKKGAVVPWAKSNPPSPYHMQVLGSLAREYTVTYRDRLEDNETVAAGRFWSGPSPGKEGAHERACRTGQGPVAMA